MRFFLSRGKFISRMRCRSFDQNCWSLWRTRWKHFSLQSLDTDGKSIQQHRNLVSHCLFFLKDDSSLHFIISSAWSYQCTKPGFCFYILHGKTTEHRWVNFFLTCPEFAVQLSRSISRKQWAYTECESAIACCIISRSARQAILS